MSTKLTNQSSQINPYHKKFKAANGEASSSNSNTITDNIQVATATAKIPSHQSQIFKQKMTESLFKLLDKINSGKANAGALDRY
jgi:hypothetical protein